MRHITLFPALSPPPGLSLHPTMLIHVPSTFCDVGEAIHPWELAQEPSELRHTWIPFPYTSSPSYCHLGCSYSPSLTLSTIWRPHHLLYSTYTGLHSAPLSCGMHGLQGIGIHHACHAMPLLSIPSPPPLPTAGFHHHTTAYILLPQVNADFFYSWVSSTAQLWLINYTAHWPSTGMQSTSFIGLAYSMAS